MTDFIISVGADFSPLVASARRASSDVEAEFARASQSGMGAVKVPRLPSSVASIAPEATEASARLQAQLAALHRLQQEVSAKALGQPTPPISRIQAGKESLRVYQDSVAGVTGGLDPQTKAKLSSIFNKSFREFSKAIEDSIGDIDNPLIDPSHLVRRFREVGNQLLPTLGVSERISVTTVDKQLEDLRRIQLQSQQKQQSQTTTAPTPTPTQPQMISRQELVEKLPEIDDAAAEGATNRVILAIQKVLEDALIEAAQFTEYLAAAATSTRQLKNSITQLQLKSAESLAALAEGSVLGTEVRAATSTTIRQDPGLRDRRAQADSANRIEREYQRRAEERENIGRNRLDLVDERRLEGIYGLSRQGRPSDAQQLRGLETQLKDLRRGFSETLKLDPSDARRVLALLSRDLRALKTQAGQIQVGDEGAAKLRLLSSQLRALVSEFANASRQLRDTGKLVADAPVRQVATTADRILARVKEAKEINAELDSLGEEKVLRTERTAGVDRTIRDDQELRSRQAQALAAADVEKEFRRRDAERTHIQSGRLDLVEERRLQGLYGLSRGGRPTEDQQLKALKAQSTTLRQGLGEILKLNLDPSDARRIIALLSRDLRALRSQAEEVQVGPENASRLNLIKAQLKDMTSELLGFNRQLRETGTLLAEPPAKPVRTAVDRARSRVEDARQLQADVGPLAEEKVLKTETVAATDRAIRDDADLKNRQAQAKAAADIEREYQQRSRERALLDRNRRDLIDPRRLEGIFGIPQTGTQTEPQQLRGLKTQLKDIREDYRKALTFDPSDGRRVFALLSRDLRALQAQAAQVQVSPENASRLKTMRAEIKALITEFAAASRELKATGSLVPPVPVKEAKTTAEQTRERLERAKELRSEASTLGEESVVRTETRVASSQSVREDDDLRVRRAQAAADLKVEQELDRRETEREHLRRGRTDLIAKNRRSMYGIDDSGRVDELKQAKAYESQMKEIRGRFARMVKDGDPATSGRLFAALSRELRSLSVEAKSIEVSPRNKSILEEMTLAAQRLKSEMAAAVRSLKEFGSFTPPVSIRTKATEKVGKTEERAAVDSEVQDDAALSSRQAKAEADLQAAAAERRRLRAEEQAARGRYDLLSKTELESRGINPLEVPKLSYKAQLREAEAQAEAIRSAFKSALDLDPVQGRALIGDLAGQLRALLNLTNTRIQVPVDDATAKTKIANIRKELTELVSQMQASANQFDLTGTLSARPAIANLLSEVGTLQKAFRNLRVDPDTHRAKENARELIAQYEQLAAIAAGIHVTTDDHDAQADVLKLRTQFEGLQQQALLSLQALHLPSGITDIRDASAAAAAAGGGGGKGIVPPLSPGFGDTPEHTGMNAWYHRIRNASGLSGFLGGGALSVLRYGLPSMFLYGGLSGAGNTVREAEELQVALSKIEAQFDATFGSEAHSKFQQFRQDILDIAKDTGLGADEIANFGQQLVGAFKDKTIGGLSGMNLVEDQTQAGAKLAQVVGLPVKEITDGLTAASLAFNSTFEEIGDVAISVEQHSGVAAKEIVSFLGDIAPAAQEAGFNLQEFASLAAVAQQRSGRSGSALAEQFGRVIPAISEAKEELLDLASQETALQDPKFLNAVNDSNLKGILEGIAKAYSDLDVRSQQFIVNLLGGRREAAAILSLFANNKTYEDILKGTENSAGMLERRFEKVRETITNTLQRAGEQLRQLGAALVNSGLGDAFATVVDLGSKLLGVLTKIVEVVSLVTTAFGGWPIKILAALAAVKLFQAGWSKGSGFLQRPGGLLNPRSLANMPETMLAYLGLPQPETRREKIAGGLRSASTGTRSAFSAFTGFFTSPVAAYRDARAPIPYERGSTNTVPPWFRLAKLPDAAEGRAAARAQIGTNIRSLKSGASSAISGIGTAASGIASLVGGWPTLGVTAAIGAYTMIKGKLETDRANLQAIIDYARDAGTSIKDLEQRAEDLRRENNGPGIFTSIKGEITGEGTDSEAEVAESELVLKRISSDRMASYKALAKKDREFQAKMRRVLFGGGVKRGLATSEGFGDLTLKYQDMDESYIDKDFASDPNFVAKTQGEPYDEGQLRAADRIAQLAGVKTKDLKKGIVRAMTRKNPVAELERLLKLDGVDAETRRQAEALLEKYRKEYSGAIESDPELADARLAAMGEDIKAITDAYNAGTVSLEEYLKGLGSAALRAQEILSKIEHPDQATIRDVLAKVNAYRKTLSNSLVKKYNIQIETDTMSAGSGDKGVLERTVADGQRLLEGGQLFGEDRRSVVKNVIEAQRALQQQFLDEAAKSGREITAEMSQFTISPATRVQAIIGGYEETGVIWSNVNETLVAALGISGDALLSFITQALDSGSMTVEAVIQYLRGLVETLKGNLRSLGWSALLGQADKAQKIFDALEVVEEMLNSFESTGRAPFDPGPTGKVDANGKSGDDAADKAKAEATALRKAKSNYEKARAGTDAVRVAQVDLEAAQLEYLEALKTPEKSDDYDALAGLENAKRAAREALYGRASSIRSKLSAINQALGNTLAVAHLGLEQAAQDLEAARASGDPDAINEAVGRFASALRGLRDEQDSKVESLIKLAQAINTDPVYGANLELGRAQELLARARGTEEEIAAQQRVVEAERALRDAMNQVRDSRYELRQAELQAMGDEVGASMMAAQLAKAQLSEALALANQGKGPGEAEINRLRAAVVTADKAASDAAFQDKLDDYGFLYNMNQITKTEYVNYLEGLKSTLIPGTKQFKDLELQIKQLKDDISGGLQMNLPTSLALPTLYEVRRLNQTGTTANGAGIGYQDNRNVQININVNNSTDQATVVAALNNALGVGVTDPNSVRLY